MTQDDLTYNENQAYIQFRGYLCTIMAECQGLEIAHCLLGADIYNPTRVQVTINSASIFDEFGESDEDNFTYSLNTLDYPALETSDLRALITASITRVIQTYETTHNIDGLTVSTMYDVSRDVLRPLAENSTLFALANEIPPFQLVAFQADSSGAVKTAGLMIMQSSLQKWGYQGCSELLAAVKLRSFGNDAAALSSQQDSKLASMYCTNVDQNFVLQLTQPAAQQGD